MACPIVAARLLEVHCRSSDQSRRRAVACVLTPQLATTHHLAVVTPAGLTIAVIPAVLPARLLAVARLRSHARPRVGRDHGGRSAYETTDVAERGSVVVTSERRFGYEELASRTAPNCLTDLFDFDSWASGPVPTSRDSFPKTP
jgi:hypothetical protein